jgi:hypothetical protein
MADYYTQFSATLNLGSKANVAKALELFEEFAERCEANEEGGGPVGFECEATDWEPHALWIHADADGNTNDVCEFVAQIGKALGLKGLWGFSWANTCNRPRVDSFGGGAAMVNLETGASTYINTNEWLGQGWPKA